MIRKSKPSYELLKSPKNNIRLTLWKIAKSNYFETFILVCIFCNILIIAFDYETASENYNNFLN